MGKRLACLFRNLLIIFDAPGPLRRQTWTGWRCSERQKSSRLAVGGVHLKVLSWPLLLHFHLENQNFLRAPRGFLFLSIPAPARGGLISQRQLFSASDRCSFCTRTFPRWPFRYPKTSYFKWVFVGVFFGHRFPSAGRRLPGFVGQRKTTPSNFKQELENDWPVIFQFCLKFGVDRERPEACPTST